MESVTLLLLLLIFQSSTRNLSSLNVEKTVQRKPQTFDHAKNRFHKHGINSPITVDVRNTFNDRINHLKKLVNQNLRKCPSNYLVLNGTIGRFNNNLIQMAHGLWVANVWNASLILPPSMRTILHYFDIRPLKKIFCFEFSDDPVADTSGRTHTISADDSFDLKNCIVSHKGLCEDLDLPRYNQRLVLQVSNHFVQFYGALWAYPTRLVKDSVVSFVEKQFGDFKYSSLHKRSLEGNCAKLLNGSILLSDFPPTQLAMDDASWRGNLSQTHPLCSMPPSFVVNTLKLNGRSPNKGRIFVAFDGQNECEGLKSLGAVFTRPLLSNTTSDALLEYVDMGVAIHGDFFILNPRSTYSWTIFVVRAALGLTSVPVLPDHDFYLRGPFEAFSRMPWVGWRSVAAVCATYSRSKASLS